MCRLLATIGPPRSLSELLLDPEHSLEVQSYAPKLMEEALLNADGFGVAWYVEGVETPARYRSVLPIWSDENLASMGAQIQAEHVLAYVRSATPGIGAGMANTQPFVNDAISFMHNGYLKGFRDGPMRRIQRELSDEAFALIRGSSDSEHLFALFMDGLFAGASTEEALDRMQAIAQKHVDGAPSLTTIIVSDGGTIHARRAGMHGGKGPTLFYHSEGKSHTVASEPLHAEEWIPFPDGGHVVMTADGIEARF